MFNEQVELFKPKNTADLKFFNPEPGTIQANYS